MEGRLLLKDCGIVGPDGALQRGMSVVVEHEHIVHIGPSGALPTLPGDWEVRARDRLLLPGRARVLPFQNTAGLDPSQLEAVTLFQLVRALRGGFTLVVEQLPPAEGTQWLMAHARAASQAGIRLVHSHASTTSAQLEVNASYVESVPGHAWVRPLMGLASSVPQLLELAEQCARRVNVGLHLQNVPASLQQLRGAIVCAELPPEARQRTEEIGAWVGGPGPCSIASTARLGAQLFEAPMGRVEVGAMADLVLFDLVPTEPVTTPAFWQELSVTPVAWTIVAGRVAVREGQLLGADYVELSRQASEAWSAIGGRPSSN